MQAKSTTNILKCVLTVAATLVALLGLLAGISLPAQGDEFTVGHTGADVAFQQYGLSGQGVTIAVVDSGIIPHPDLTTYGFRITCSASFVPAALQSTAVARMSALSPTLTRDGLGNVYVDASKSIWGEKIIWGTSTLTNSQIIWGTDVWTNKIIWGTSSSAVDLSARAIGGE